ncbi:MAG TPA: hypothetical protein VIL01_11000 [Thermomicrobiales bacterium]
MEGWSDAAVVAIVPGLVEVAKRVGLPATWAGVAAIVAATILVGLRDLALGAGATGSIARWLLTGVTLGLAAAGLYSQVRRIAIVPAEQASGQD